MDTDDDGTDRAYHYNKNPRKIYVSRSFPDKPGVPKMRYVSQVTDQDEGLAFVDVDGEIVLARTASGRFEIRATVVEDSRKVTSVLIQRFSSKSGPSERDHFTFQEGAINRILQLFETIKTMPLDRDSKIHLTTDEIGAIALDKPRAERLFAEHEALFRTVAENSETLEADLQALGYRRKILRTFERMLTDAAFFEGEKKRLNKTDEAIWQSFFEANTWIFGYGLCYQFLGQIDEGKIERYVVGHDIGSAGKRADAVLKTQARLNSLCFVEIKHHKTDLLHHSPYRAGAWMPDKEVVGAVAQVQATVQAAVERYSPTIEITDENGEPVSEPVFVVHPRAFVVVGSLEQFVTDGGKINAKKMRAFEIYRRNLHSPEVLTFDELLHRARFIVGDGTAPDFKAADDDVPF